MRSRDSLLLILILLIVLFAVIALFIFVVRQDRNLQQSPAGNGVVTPAPQARLVYPESGRPSSSRMMQAPKRPASCSTLGIGCTSSYLQPWQEPVDGSCRAQIRNGYPVPDPQCTPGGINPTVELSVIQNSAWRTRCIRDCEESQAKKHAAYRWYRISSPHHNSGSNQVCELDHLVPLELGGADGMGNIWPECGPDGAALADRNFKIKDRVENYLANEVKAGRMPLDAAQRGIAEDWTQYLDAANQYCAQSGRC